ncbi:predicted protein [Histoplasma mississippiense (nom. inval.)]|uniref:Vacuolar membrane protease n=1 Tax=Ajellomyces capsulatus (strain NAm1 / WU24) TaxID=2059318 RepID=PFF1_AJECN|nr:predicted protein [Histoplasma mississippiense (nom. inval.)]A6QS12.1 RecName: Full=Vacuolar membrane protease; AltName: Full=FXNA-related family protease 1 [Histoplasma mississippiense (nom. inval.)]EDN02304.1 predicted protein [Histoplasma mississippiense (nom. inval.)]
MASSRAQWFNPIAFTPWPVTCITTIVYLALLIPILVINLVVPSAPETNPKGVNLTEAWRDLQHLTGGFHPYNSRRNDEVHEWLLSRINSIIRPTVEAGQPSSANDNLPEVFVFDDNRSNLTYSNGGVGKTSIVGVYFESTNIIVYIRGSEDGLENWWEHSNGKPKGKGGVLVNAHYDSVSTGYGATDDGIGVVSLLQLLRYFTTPGNNPRKGLVLLFNNGEEDYLNGAHPPEADTTQAQDDTRHTNIDSLWHMLSASIGTTEGLVSYTGMDFDGKSKDQNKVNSGTGTLGVWFDMFGTAFAVFRLHTLFAISVALLVIAPLVIFVTSVILSKTDRMYLFSMSKSLEGTGDQVSLRGLRGFSRTPIILVIATTIPICLAYLLEKVNPYIVHSSQFSVWSMMFSAWIFLAWFLACAADFFRPSALHRAYSYTWIFIATWIMLVINTVYANQKGIAAGPSTAEFPGAAGEDTDPTESTSLLRGQRTTFANYRSSRPGGAAETDEREDINKGGTFEHEQSWSWTLPRWTWVLQLLLLAPIVLILVGQLALFLTASMCQVGSDGVSTFVVYLACSVFTTLLCIPLFPLIHRFTYHIPTFLFLVFIGTLIYNLVAFPFSPANRLKTFFIQEVDLDNGSNTVSLTGIQPYLTDAINSIPSAAGQNITCDKTTPFGKLERCSWSGLSPNVLGQGRERDNEIDPDKWITYNITKTVGKNKARIEISGRNTRACKLKFDRAVANFQVSGSAVDHRMPPTSRQGVSEIRLWSRTWENTWVVDINWHESADKSDDDDDDHDDENHDAPQNILSGKAICMWSDGNQPGVIPALDEVRLYAPSWIAISKAADGLVEASHSFTIQ